MRGKAELGRSTATSRRLCAECPAATRCGATGAGAAQQRLAGVMADACRVRRSRLTSGGDGRDGSSRNDGRARGASRSDVRVRRDACHHGRDRLEPRSCRPKPSLDQVASPKPSQRFPPSASVLRSPPLSWVSCLLSLSRTIRPLTQVPDQVGSRNGNMTDGLLIIVLFALSYVCCFFFPFFFLSFGTMCKALLF
jgi:hypothetical protein